MPDSELDFRVDSDGSATEAEVFAAGLDAFSCQRERAAASGGFCLELENHVLTYLPGRGKRLVVTFDNLASLRETRDRTAWGQRFLLAQGFDILGVQIRRSDWFRDAGLIATLRELQDDGFFQRCPAVSMFGSSMGAFGALAFAPLAPGCTVMAFAPQRSLERSLCPWEKRYRWARTNFWTADLPFGDAAEGPPATARSYIAFDPQHAQDRKHAAALDGPKTRLLPMPHAGHKLPPALLRMDLLKPLVLAAFEDRLDPVTFRRLMRGRRGSVPWRAGLLERALARGHLRLGLRAADRMMADDPHWKIRKLRQALKAALAG